MIVMGRDYSYISIRRADDRLWLRVAGCTDADRGAPEREVLSQEVQAGELYLRLTVDSGALCRFSYSVDGEVFTDAGDQFTARQGMWIGAKVGFFAMREGFTNDAGYIDIDWFRILTTN
jgi:hypothetical protein